MPVSKGFEVRVLIVTQYFHPENFGINEIAYDLVCGGHAVTVLTGLPNYPSGRIEPGYRGLRVRYETIRGVSVIRVPIVPRGRTSLFLLALNYLSFAIVASLLGPFLVRKRMDVVLVYQLSPLTVGLPALVLRLFYKVPIVWWIQDIWPESLVAVNLIKSTALVRSIRALARFIYRRCRIVLVQSPAYTGRLRALGLPDADIRYLPNSAADYYRPLVPPRDAPERQLLSAGFNVVFAGNIGLQQDPRTILAAAELLRNVPEIHWAIVGDGRLRQWVANEITERTLLACRLLPPQSPERMPFLIGLADVLLITLSRSCISGLTIPSKLQSYLACGRPIVGAVDGETSRIIRDSGAGVACPSGDARALADAVLSVYRMPAAQRAAMAKAARTYFEQNFGRGSLVGKLSDWLTEASSDRQSPWRMLERERISAE